MEKETYKRIGKAMGTIWSIADSSIKGIKGLRNAPPVPGSSEKLIKAVATTWEKREELKWVADGAKTFAKDNIVPLAKNGAKAVTSFVTKK